MRRSLLVTAIVTAGAPLVAALSFAAPRSIPSDGPATLAARPATDAASAAAAGDAAVRFGDVRLATGVRLRYAEQGDPDGRPVILLHGFSDSWFSFSRVLPLLPPGWHVYALDQRGHGDSDRPRDGYHMRDLAADVVAFMDASGIARATIVGHSMGSFAAQQAALLAPDRVERLVLVGSSPGIRTMAGYGDFDASVMALRDTIPVEFISEFQLSTVNTSLPDDFLARVIAESRKLPAHVWHGIMGGMSATDAPAALGRSAIPTLLLFGEKDAVFPRVAQDSLRTLLPRAKSIFYPETGHAPHWERPDRFVADVVAFIDAPAAGR